MELLKPSEVAVSLRVTVRTVQRLIKRGDLPAVKVGERFRIRKDDLDAYLQRQRPSE